jgi:transcriptional regulator with XRE-family HTH domain
MVSQPSRLGSRIAHARRARGWSLADLASATYVSRGWINNVEAGRRWPARAWVAKVEELLRAPDLTAEWDQAEREREAESSLQRLMNKAERESRSLLTAPDAVEVDRLNEGAVRLAVDYLAGPPRPVFEQAMLLRGEMVRRAKSGHARQSELRDLYVGIGRISGVLAYTALDLDHSRMAATHAAVSFKMGQAAGDNELKAWTRGTQSLIARFEQRYQQAQDSIDDGLRYAGAGTSRVRLLCGGAQCAANLGDSATAMAFITEAREARERSQSDAIEGLFGFSPAKQAYYSASSLMWLPNRRALTIATRSALQAIEIWQHEPVEQRSLDDEALAHVYLATARLKLGEVEGAMSAVRPIMQLPKERQISWIRKRIGGLTPILDHHRFANSTAAADAREELASYAAQS